MLKPFLIAAVLAATALPAAAKIVRVKAAQPVDITGDQLVAAVDEAGATVVARVDHSDAAAMAGMTLPPETVVIFGNAKIGTPVMEQDPLAGLFLPLKVLIYADDKGQVWLAYEDPADMFAGLKVDPKSDAVKKMSDALAKLTATAAE